jgi:hypothetical protein
MAISQGGVGDRRWPIVVKRKDVIYNLRKRLEDAVLNESTEWVG